MQTWMFALFGILSLASSLGVGLYALVYYPRKKHTLSPLLLCTIGVFGAVLFMYIPVYYCCYPFGDSLRVLRPFLLSVHNTMRTFILDGEFDIIRDAAADLPAFLRMAYMVYASILYVLAPALTFSNVMSLFQNFQAGLRYRCLPKSRKIYILSELNPKSMVLAKSIAAAGSTGRDRPAIVFTDVYPADGEEDSELQAAAQELHAICLRNDVTRLELAGKQNPMEIFLMGQDESENVSQAMEIMELLKKKNAGRNKKLFVFARSTGSFYALNSQEFGSLLDDISEKPDPSVFKMRIVNERRQLVWRTVPRMQLVERSRDKVISVLIAGMGEYGMEFFKMLVWYCQLDGYKLEINVVDGSTDISGRLRRRFPELMATNPSQEDGEANYDIRVYEGVDLNTDAFAQLLQSQGEDGERLRRTGTAIVTMGQDDRNIEAAVYLRTLFDRANGVVAKDAIRLEEEQPQIYSIVYDEKKAGLLQSRDDDQCGFLINHKRIPYHIHFVGSLAEQFSYENVYDFQTENQAFYNHISWSEINRLASRELIAQGKTQQEIADAGFAYQIEDESVERKKYERFSYFRQSSVAKALHKRMVTTTPGIREQMLCREKEKSVLCMCPNCERRKKTEHMRWNAYMRIDGFVRADKRADRALCHNDLVNWSELTKWGRAKDD